MFSRILDVIIPNRRRFLKKFGTTKYISPVLMKRMLEFQKNEEAEIRRIALLAFKAKYPERKILTRWRIEPKKDKDGNWIACIVWNSKTRPPNRTWWIRKSEMLFEEISEKEVSNLISISKWL